jgi:hydroxylamine reductase
MTTNCIQKPKDSYIDRIFTTGPVAFNGVTHIPSRTDFSILIKKAKELGGFKSKNHIKKILVGFNHNTVLSLADKIIDYVKNGKIKHFYLIGGCDGAKSGRNYYTELAEAIPNDSIILTLACGKYRFNKLDFGTIDGIPRLLDIGQCNDAYSAIKIALALSNAFNVG